MFNNGGFRIARNARAEVTESLQFTLYCFVGPLMTPLAVAIHVYLSREPSASLKPSPVFDMWKVLTLTFFFVNKLWINVRFISMLP